MNPHDSRRLRDVVGALEASEPEDLGALRAHVGRLFDACLAAQSLDDLGSDAANDAAWDNYKTLSARYEAAKKRLDELDPPKPPPPPVSLEQRVADCLEQERELEARLATVPKALSALRTPRDAEMLARQVTAAESALFRIRTTREMLESELPSSGGVAGRP